MLKEFGGAIISVSHDRKYIEEVCTRVLQLTENGLKEASAPLKEVSCGSTFYVRREEELELII